MRVLVVRATALLALAVLVVTVAVAALGSQPKVLTPRSYPVPDVQCPVGVSPAQTFCYVGATPNGSNDTLVPPSTQASTEP